MWAISLIAQYYVNRVMHTLLLLLTLREELRYNRVQSSILRKSEINASDFNKNSDDY